MSLTPADLTAQERAALINAAQLALAALEPDDEPGIERGRE